jgi:transcriptional regulator of nitric oxide reductase
MYRIFMGKQRWRFDETKPGKLKLLASRTESSLDAATVVISLTSALAGLH